MVFSSPVFLFLFFPAVLILYYSPIFPSRKWKNYFLFAASIVFYAWGEPVYVLLMIVSIFVNWGFGLAIQAGRSVRIILGLAVAFNLLFLFFFKYYDFAVDTVDNFLNFSLPILGLELPIGISFYTFQAISYLIDVKRKPELAQKNPLYLGLYISCFPQLVAGPIVRYETVEAQINARKESWSLFVAGLRRFLWGLAKKVLLANNLALVADQAFDGNSLSTGLAWMGMVAYTLQIYFDFSGYSDMAIGLGKIFGFHFPENFNYPYISKSITEFWRRWHMSLSSWFRDYVYIPLGGNRVSPGRHIWNLFVVWLLTGIWHGASWNFILWGLLYFVLLLLEKYTPLRSLPAWVGHGYTLLAVGICWVFFRAETLSGAVSYLQAMFTLSPVPFWNAEATMFLTNYAVYFLLGILLSIPIYPWIKKQPWMEKGWVKILSAAGQLLVFFLTIGFIFSNNYDPFIYFNF